ncbi:HTH_Tnp_Tc3_2 domain-containing protein [Trichonephila clavipes]|nr:HTH_Tnp_Tc3_2 domain-containing protein [Trichonephila clavipes]
MDCTQKQEKRPFSGPNPSVSSEGFFDFKLNQNVEGVIVCDAPCDSVMNANESFFLEVSEELGIAQSVISRLFQRFQDDGNVSRYYSTGRPRVTTPNEDRYLAVNAKRNTRSTTSDLSRQLSSATGMTVSRQTVYRRLGHTGLYARRPVRCVTLTATTVACD